MFYAEGMDPSAINTNDFVIKAEEYGVPQARHRVILLGIRNDPAHKAIDLLRTRPRVSVRSAIASLPLRSRLSSGDDAATWEVEQSKAWCWIGRKMRRKGIGRPEQAPDGLPSWDKWRLANRRSTCCIVCSAVAQDDVDKWSCDSQLSVWLNHEARSHMKSDLGRYFCSRLRREVWEITERSHRLCREGLSPPREFWTTGKFGGPLPGAVVRPA